MYGQYLYHKSVNSSILQNNITILIKMSTFRFFISDVSLNQISSLKLKKI